MRRYKADKVVGRDNFRVFRERRKVLAISRDEIIGTGRIGTFHKDVVVRIARHLKPPGGDNQMAMVLDQLEQLKTQPSANGQFGTRQDIPIFL